MLRCAPPTVAPKCHSSPSTMAKRSCTSHTLLLSRCVRHSTTGATWTCALRFFTNVVLKRRRNISTSRQLPVRIKTSRTAESLSAIPRGPAPSRPSNLASIIRSSRAVRSAERKASEASEKFGCPRNVCSFRPGKCRASAPVGGPPSSHHPAGKQRSGMRIFGTGGGGLAFGRTDWVPGRAGGGISPLTRRRSGPRLLGPSRSRSSAVWPPTPRRASRLRRSV